MHKISNDLKTTILENIIQNVEEGNAFLLSENYTYKVVKPENSKFTLEELQKLVGGYIEVYPTRLLSPMAVFLCDEEGLLKKRKFNNLFYDVFGETAVGNVLVVPKKVLEWKADTLVLPIWVAKTK